MARKREKKSVDAAVVVAQFRTLNHSIYLFCEKVARHINSLPDRASCEGRHQIVGPYGVQRPRRSFSSVEDHYLFTLLSVVNCRLCEYIFSPSHPSNRARAGVVNASEGLPDGNFLLQKEAAESRSNQFSAAEGKFSKSQTWALFDEIGRTIMEDMLLNFPTSQEPDSNTANMVTGTRRWMLSKIPQLPVRNAKEPYEADKAKDFREGLRTITRDAYTWNRTAKREVLEYDLVPFVFRPREKWDPKEMEAFARAGVIVEPGEEIVSSVSLGLKASVALATERLTHVQEKAIVLVEAYLAPPQTPDEV